MAEIKGNAAPTIETKGAIGDIYTDVSTGDQYKCTFGYCCTDNEYYEWRKIGKVDMPEKVEVASEEDVTEPEEVEVASEEDVTEPEKVEVETVQDKPQRKTNYTKYSTASSKNK